MKRWRIREAAPSAVNRIAETLFLPRALAHMLVSRGIDTPEKVASFSDLSLSKLMSPFDLCNMEEACALVLQAVESKQKILIHGDFDADGITSSALFSLFFDKIGYPIEVYIPNRLQENHGISKIAIEKAISEKYALLITCDCGSSSHESVQQLVDGGVRVIVTDHHHVGEPLPKGALLVNPQQVSNRSHMEELAGVGVVFLTIMALRKKMRDRKYFEQQVEPNLKSFLDIVALGTIADLAPIQGVNRVLVSQGLDVMRSSPQPGIQALKSVGGVDMDQNIRSQDVGFRIAPKINAAARLGHANEAFDLLTCQDVDKASFLSQRLLAYNEERKSKQEKMFKKAYPEIKRQVEMGHQVLVVASKDFHPGIIGLLAQKMSQEFRRPAFAFCLEGKTARGSARSPEGFHLVDLMDRMSDLLIAYGGHAQAGGCSIVVENLQGFSNQMQQGFQALYADQEQAVKWVDAQLDLIELNEMFFQKLDTLQPFGMGYPYPIFEVEAVVQGKPFEVGQDHLKCKVKDRNGRVLNVIAFGKYNAWKSKLSGSLCLVVQPEKTYFRGRPQISLQLLDFA